MCVRLVPRDMHVAQPFAVRRIGTPACLVVCSSRAVCARPLGVACPLAALIQGVRLNFIPPHLCLISPSPLCRSGGRSVGLRGPHAPLAALARPSFGGPRPHPSSAPQRFATPQPWAIRCSCPLPSGACLEPARSPRPGSNLGPGGVFSQPFDFRVS